jgi:hypothetical protein
VAALEVARDRLAAEVAWLEAGSAEAKRRELARVNEMLARRHAEARRAGPRQPPTEDERDRQALEVASDGDLIVVLTRYSEERVKAMHEDEIEAELTRRGFHYYPEKKTWAKG